MEEIKNFGEFQDKNQNESVKNFEEYQVDEKFSLAKLKKDLADIEALDALE